MLGLVGYGGEDDEEIVDKPQVSTSTSKNGKSNPKKRTQVEFEIPRPSKQMKLADEALLREDEEEQKRKEEQIQQNALAAKRAGLGLLASLPKPKQAPPTTDNSTLNFFILALKIN